MHADLFFYYNINCNYKNNKYACIYNNERRKKKEERRNKKEERYSMQFSII